MFAFALEFGVPAFGALHALGDEFLDRPFVPRVGAVDVEHRRRLVDERLGQHRRAALRAVHRRDRHAPDALARDAPVGPVGDHALDARLSPRRDPARVADRLERALAQVLRVHRDEPLRRREEDHRVVAAPAVRIRVIEVFAMPEEAPVLERLFDLRVGVRDLEAGEHLDRLVEAAAWIERRVDLEAVADAGLVVVGAVAGRGMNRAGAGFERDVIAKDAERIARVKRMAEHQPLHLPCPRTWRGACRMTCRFSFRRPRPDPSRR